MWEFWRSEAERFLLLFLSGWFLTCRVSAVKTTEWRFGVPERNKEIFGGVGFACWVWKIPFISFQLTLLFTYSTVGDFEGWKKGGAAHIGFFV
jgi:hypothetical protein